MKKTSSLFCEFALLAANACAMAGLFTLVSKVEHMENSDPALALWLICLLLCQIALAIFIRQRRSIRAVVIFISSFFAAQLILSLLIYGFFSSFMGMLIAFAMWAYSYYSVYELINKKLTAERLAKSFDLCCLMLVFLVFFCLVKELSLQLVLPLGLSCIYALVTLVILRGGGERKLKSLALSSALVGVIAVLSTAVALLFSGGIGRLVSGISAALYAMLRFIYRCINELFLFFISLMPQKEYELLSPELQESMQTVGAQDMSFSLMDGETFIIIVLCVAFFAALLMLLYRLINGKNKVQYGSVSVETGMIRKKSSLIFAIKKAFSKLARRLIFATRCLAERNTAPGLFRQLEIRSRSKLRGRGDGESCREYIYRVMALYPWAKFELCKLADALDALYFGPGEGLTSSQIKQMRKVIFKNNEAAEA